MSDICVDIPVNLAPNENQYLSIGPYTRSTSSTLKPYNHKETVSEAFSWDNRGTAVMIRLTAFYTQKFNLTKAHYSMPSGCLKLLPRSTNWLVQPLLIKMVTINYQRV